MQMVMMVFRTSLENEVLPWVEREQLPYTRLDGAQGKGSTGSAEGLTSWGNPNTVLLLAVSDDRLSSVRDHVITFQKKIEEQRRGAGVPFHIFVLPCIQWM